MIRTYTRAEAARLTLPAELLPGVLDGWTGPVLDLDGKPCVVIGPWLPRFPTDYVIARADGAEAMSDDGPSVSAAPASALRLPLSYPEVQHRICVVLAAGERCDGECCGNGEIEGGRGEPPRVDCPSCAGTGWLRKPAPAWHLLPVALGGTLPNENAWAVPALLDAHARRVLAGKGPMCAVVRPWGQPGSHAVYMDRPTVAGEGAVQYAPYSVPNRHWHGWSSGFARGPETGEVGKAAADAAALAAGFALLDGDVLRVEVPDAE